MSSSTTKNWWRRLPRRPIPTGPLPGAARAARDAARPPIHVQLEAGHAYRLRVESKSNGPNGSAQLSWIPPAEPLLAEAVDAVKNSDVAVVFVGLNPSLEGEEMQVNQPGFAGGDRTDLRLPEDAGASGDRPPSRPESRWWWC